MSMISTGRIHILYGSKRFLSNRQLQFDMVLEDLIFYLESEVTSVCFLDSVLVFFEGRL